MSLEFWMQQKKMHEFTIVRLKEMLSKAIEEQKSLLHNDYRKNTDYENEIRDYKTAIKRNKSSIKKIEVYMANYK